MSVITNTAPAVELKATERSGDVYVHGRLFGWYHAVGPEGAKNHRWAIYIPGRGIRKVDGPEEAKRVLLGLAKTATRAGKES